MGEETKSQMKSRQDRRYTENICVCMCTYCNILRRQYVKIPSTLSYTMTPITFDGFSCCCDWIRQFARNGQRFGCTPLISHCQ
jgi:hypothetical protein